MIYMSTYLKLHMPKLGSRMWTYWQMALYRVIVVSLHVNKHTYWGH